MFKERTGSARGTDTPWYRGWDLTDEQRTVFRETTRASQAAKKRALTGECDQPKHPINVPRLDPLSLMPQCPRSDFTALSLFSGGGGMDIGFDRAGFAHAASYEILSDAADIIRAAHPDWKVFGGPHGDVTSIDWSCYRGRIDVLHGGPPCQPFSHAGHRAGANDVRNMIPEFVRAVRAVRPSVFVCENVVGMRTKQFENYIDTVMVQPLSRHYAIRSFCLDAADYGVPQKRRRVFFVGFQDEAAASAFSPPPPTHSHSHLGSDASVRSMLQKTMGAREALGLPSIGLDALAPTIRSGLTGPRHTTSILNSVSALKVWDALQIWPNGVAENRERAHGYVVQNGHFRLSVADCMVLQGFPGNWPLKRPVYFALGMIGNSVAPPMAYRLARAVQAALSKATPGRDRGA